MRRFKWTLLSVGALLAACAQSMVAPQPEDDGIQASPANAVPQPSLTQLVPAPEFLSMHSLETPNAIREHDKELDQNYFDFGRSSLSERIFEVASPSLKREVLQPPLDSEKSKIAELALFIVKTDDFRDPRHLFYGTLKIKSAEKYDDVEKLPWGIAVGAGGRSNPQEISHLPKGIRAVLFSRVNPSGANKMKRAELDISIDYQDSCVTLNDVVAVFGGNFSIDRVPIVAPNGAGANSANSSEFSGRNYHSVSYEIPPEFLMESTGFTRFVFSYGSCVRSIEIRREFL